MLIWFSEWPGVIFEALYLLPVLSVPIIVNIHVTLRTLREHVFSLANRCTISRTVQTCYRVGIEMQVNIEVQCKLGRSMFGCQWDTFWRTSRHRSILVHIQSRRTNQYDLEIGLSPPIKSIYVLRSHHLCAIFRSKEKCSWANVPHGLPMCQVVVVKHIFVFVCICRPFLQLFLQRPRGCYI